MLTRCPRCKTSFRVLAEHLKLAHGRVQCGRCYIQFDAIETLYDEEPDAVPRLDATLPGPETAEAVGAEGTTSAGAMAPAVDEVEAVTHLPESSETPSPVAESSDPARPEAAFETEGAAQETPDVPFEIDSPTDEIEPPLSVRLDAEDASETEIDEAARREIPIGDLNAFDTEAADDGIVSSRRRDAGSRRDIDEDDVLLQDFNEPVVAREHVDDALIEAQAHPVENRRTHPLWGVLAALLLLLGAGQFVWYQRENLVERFPPLRPVIEAACARLGCTLQPRRDLDAIKVLARDVREHPRFKNSLLVNATIENEAAFTQPYPVLELTLYDADGQPIGVRRFQPNEYLDSSVPVAQGMKPGQPVYIVLEIARPAADAVSFEFKFY